MHISSSFSQYAQKGFTLIETIVGIVVLAISISVLTSTIYPIAEQSADQLHQVKAAELAQSMLNEIQNKAFDQKSDMAGGRIRCGELGILCSDFMGPDTVAGIKETRATFNDVDDYNDLKYGSVYNKGDIENSQGITLDLYTGYSMLIEVCNDANYDGSCTGDNFIAKLITVKITTPTGFSMNFATYRANF